MNTILYQAKELKTTLKSPIYKLESNVDCIRFLVDSTDLDINNCCVLYQYIYPDGTKGIIDNLNFEEVLYKNKYLKCDLPILSKHTIQTGMITICLNIIELDTEGNKVKNIYTNAVYLEITDVPIISDDIPEPDDPINISLVKLQKQVLTMQKQQIQSVKIDERTNKLCFYNDKTYKNELFTVDLPEEIQWHF